MTEEKSHYCSFCGKSGHEVSVLIAGPVTFICNECVAACVTVIARRAARREIGEIAVKTVSAGNVTAGPLKDRS